MPRPHRVPSVETHTMYQRLAAEFLGTFVLVFGGCGAAVLASGVPDVGIGYLGVALAFGLTVVTMAYAVGHISGGHFNPAITLGVAIARRFRWADVLPYVVTQVVASVVAAVTLLSVANGKDGFDAGTSGFASNGYGDRSPQGYSLLAVIIVEVVLTAVFLFVILGRTDTRAPKGFAPIAIGLLAHPDPPGQHPGQQHLGEPGPVDGTRPLRRDDAMAQLWVFWVAPLAGAAIAGAVYAFLLGHDETPVPLSEATEA